MAVRKSLISAHKKDLVNTAVETLLTSNWIPDTSLPEDVYRKIFSQIFNLIERDLLLEDLTEDGYYLTRHYVDIFNDRPILRRNFHAHLLILGIARLVLNHSLVHGVFKIAGDFQNKFELIQKIFDYTLISLSEWWGKIYQEIRDNDHQLIGELNIVKNELQKQLDITYQILKESPVGALVCDNDFNIVHWNPMAARLSGYQPNEILNKSVLKIFTEKSKKQLIQKLNSDRKRLTNLRLYIQPKTQPPFLALVSISLFKGLPAGKSSYVINFQSVDNQSELLHHKQRLDQLEMISRLTSSIMHDIRNPINSIGLNVELLEQAIKNDKQETDVNFGDLFTKIQKEIAQLSKNLNQYLSYTQIAETYPEPINLSDQLKSLIEDISLETTSRKIQIKLFKDTRHHVISGDWLQLRRAFMNIIRNSMEAYQEGGEIQIKLSKQKNRVIVGIKDFGPGVSPEEKKKIFQPFFTTKKSGTGLGLFITKQIVIAHQGRILLRSHSGKGMSFSISFPALKMTEE
jgi:signal transduction histidine kinase